ncbi:MAG: PorP/SprF family type IX secretion system membrane protein [Phaeodactylibacter sp.]|nr:PorP/SprF family type IX secretion system membrane protein [Phaeodactylibacter sp.]
MALFLSFLMPLRGQQLPIFTQYREYHGYINPAAVNSDYLLYEYNSALSVSYRQQWEQVEGSPRNLFVKGEHLFRGPGSFSLLGGFTVIRDEAHPFSFTGTYLRLAACLAKDPYAGAISLGFNLGFVQYRTATAGLEVREAGDPGLTSSEQASGQPDIGFGVYYHRQLANGDNIYGGLSVPQFAMQEYAFSDEMGRFAIKQRLQCYVLAGYYHYYESGAFLEPSVWVRYLPGLPMSIDLNCRYSFAQQFWAGAGISSSANAHLEAGYLLGSLDRGRQNLKIGYGFDFGLQESGNLFGPAHEINLAWVFDSRKKRF